MSQSTLVPSAAPSPPSPPRLLDQVRQVALVRFGRPEPGARYAEWVRRFVLFQGKRHPRELGVEEVGRFLAFVAQSEKDPLRCLEQAREALGFLYREVLHLELALPELGRCRGESPAAPPPPAPTAVQAAREPRLLDRALATSKRSHGALW